MRKHLKASFSCKKQSGYTLLEMAIVMLVIGIFVAGMIPLYSLYLEKTKLEDTKRSEKQVDAAINQFKNLRGRYPCPARYDIPAGAAGYGEEVLNCNTTVTLTAGECGNGLCVEESERTDIIIGGTAVVQNVFRGAVPFVTLGLNEKDAYDQYGSRFSYAISGLLTDKRLFRASRGGISVVDGHIPNPQSVIKPDHSAHYFLFSHGPDQIGSYLKTGEQFSTCGFAMYDNENCNTDATNKLAIYRQTPRSDEAIIMGNVVATPPVAGGPPPAPNTHYDDIATFVGVGEQPLWEIAEDNTGRMLDTMNLHDSVPRRVLVGKDAVFDATGNLIIQVQGVDDTDPDDGVVEATKVRTEEICDPNNADCIEPVLLAAPYPATPTAIDPRSLQCAKTSTGKAPTAIENKEIVCVPAPPKGQCTNANDFVIGFDSKGGAICGQGGKKCSEKIVKVCTVNKPLPESKSGVMITLTGGASYQVNYKCDDGTWKKGTSSGVCDCTPGSTTQTSACGANMSGEITTTTTTVCPSGQQTSKQTGNSCQCVPSSTTSTKPCAAGQTGNTTTTTMVSCVGNKPTTTTAQTGNTCACVPETKTQKIDCPQGYDGKRTQTMQKTCPAGSATGVWGTWTDTSNTCTCKAPTTTKSACDTTVFNAGTVTTSCSYNCNMSTLSPATKSCTTDSSACKCIPTSNTVNKPCPSGFTGTMAVTTATTCNPLKTTTTEDKSQCQPAMMSCKMKVTDSSVLSSNTKVPNGAYEENDVCTAPVSSSKCAQIKTCYRTAGPGTYTRHFCACE